MKQNLSIDKARTFKGLSGVYKITNLKTGEFYIGSGKLQIRYKRWRGDFNNKKKFPWLWENNNKLSDFEFEIIELYPVYDKDILRDLEQKHKDNLQPTLNRAEKTTGGNYSGEKNPMYGKPGSLKNKFGKEHPFYGKQKETRKSILQFDLKGNLIKEWDYTRQVRNVGLNESPIIKCCKGERKTAYGYIWKYKD